MRPVHWAPLAPGNQGQAPPVLLVAQDSQADRYSSRPAASTVLRSTHPAVRANWERPARLGEREEMVVASVVVIGSARQMVDAVDAAVTVGSADMGAKSSCSFPRRVATTSAPESAEGRVVGVEMVVQVDAAVVGALGGAASKVGTQVDLGVAVAAPEGAVPTASSGFWTFASKW